MRASRRWVLLTLAPLAVALMGAPPAGAATLSPEVEYFFGEPCCYSVVFRSTSVPNKLVIGGAGSELVVVRDPNVPISTPAAIDVPEPAPEYIGDEVPTPLWTSMNCVAPTHWGHAACAITPGRGPCNTGGCWFTTEYFVLHIWLGADDDTVTLLPGSIDTEVSTGAGNDTLDTRNRVEDTVSCGEGVDVVIADQADRLGSSCEVVRRSRFS